VTLSSPLLSSPETAPDPSPSAGVGAAGSPRLRHAPDPRVRCYSSRFADLMEMRAPAAQVSAYLDRHEGWFRRCAAPMAVTPLGRDGYTLTLGRFGNFGFEVEPTIGLQLLPQCEGIYRILTVGPGPGEGSALDALYDVEFNAALELDEGSLGEATGAGASFDVPAVTMVRWQLDLHVWIRLPGVITLLPDNLVQSSGEHLLRQIVRQISRRLTWKVQEDFHASHGLPCPPRQRAQF
jgi:hypothetical protein